MAQWPLQYIGPPPLLLEETLLDELRGDMRRVERDLLDRAAIMEETGQHRADREPWLIHTGFPAHLHGLHDEEIWSSYKLPKADSILLRGGTSRRGIGEMGNDADQGSEDNDIRRILAAADTLLQGVYRLVSDKSLTRSITQQYA